MRFFAVLKATSQDILRKVDQEAAFKNAEKDAQSEVLELRDGFMQF
jgi:hypothetical protein